MSRYVIWSLAMMFIGMAALSRNANAEILNLSAASCNASGVCEWVPAWVAAQAFDGDQQTPWASNNGENWIWVDLGADKKINTVKIDFENSYAIDYTLRIRSSALGQSDVPSAYAAVATIAGRDIGLAANEFSSGNLGNWDDTFDFNSGTVSFDYGSATTSSVNTDVVGRYLMLCSTSMENALTCVGEIQVDASPIPEPSTIVLMSLGLVGLLCYAWKRWR